MSEVALFFEKMHKVFQNKAQRCSTPLRMKEQLLLVIISFKHLRMTQMYTLKDYFRFVHDKIIQLVQSLPGQAKETPNTFLVILRVRIH